MSEFYLEAQADFEAHNKKVAEAWDAYYSNKPAYVPVLFAMSERIFLMNKELNKWGYTWKDYFEGPEIRWQVDLECQKWVRFNVIQDAEMGMPTQEWSGIKIGFQDCEEPAWFGCPIAYPEEGGVPLAMPILKEDKKKFYELKIPDSLSGGITTMIMEQYEYLEEKRKKVDFEGRPVGKTVFRLGGTDGPFTIACSLRGATEISVDFYEDPQYVHDLLSFITDATILRIKKIKEFLKQEVRTQSWYFADDRIELISPETYKNFILPYHKKLLAEFSNGGPNAIHLCGRVQRHLKILKDELNIKTFDLGFPVDMGKAREDLGEDVTLIGNIAPHLLKSGPPQAVRDAVKRLCESGVMKGGKFILHDGNDCAPETPARHFQAMYEAGKEYGRY